MENHSFVCCAVCVWVGVVFAWAVLSTHPVCRVPTSGVLVMRDHGVTC